jgi:hypothetical protein
VQTGNNLSTRTQIKEKHFSVTNKPQRLLLLSCPCLTAGMIRMILWTEVVSAVIIVGSVRHKNVARAADLIIIVGVYIMFCTLLSVMLTIILCATDIEAAYNAIHTHKCNI